MSSGPSASPSSPRSPSPFWCEFDVDDVREAAERVERCDTETDGSDEEPELVPTRWPSNAAVSEPAEKKSKTDSLKGSAGSSTSAPKVPECSLI